MSKRPSGRTTTWVWFPYFSVAVAYPEGSGLLTVGPTSISKSAGIFQKYLPSNSATIPSGMNCLYCCQFCMVIFVPGGIPCDLSVSWAGADVNSGHRIKVVLRSNARTTSRRMTSSAVDVELLLRNLVHNPHFEVSLTSGPPCAGGQNSALGTPGLYKEHSVSPTP